MHRKCNICGGNVILSPSAAERAKKYGGTAEYYLDLFPAHAGCTLRKRLDGERELLIRKYKEN